MTPQKAASMIHTAERASKRAKAAQQVAHRELQYAQKHARKVAPVRVGDMVPLDTGGSGEVLSVEFKSLDTDRIRFNVMIEELEQVNTIVMVVNL
jgi:hypothetical protein